MEARLLNLGCSLVKILKEALSESVQSEKVLNHILDDAPVFFQYRDYLGNCKMKVHHYSLDGDVILGGVLALSPEECKEFFLVSDLQAAFGCHFVSTTEILDVLTFEFAIREINEREDLLPNITLGFEIYDSGISYGAKDPTLENKDDYPDIFHTMPSDRYLKEAIVALLQYFEWKWVGMITDINVNYKRPSEEIKKDIIKIGYCVEFFIVVGPGNDNGLAETIRNYHANVIILYCPLNSDGLPFLMLLNANGKVWIIITEEGKLLSADLVDYLSPLHGSLWFAIHKEEIPDLKVFRHSASPTALPRNAFLYKYLKDDGYYLSSYFKNEINVKLSHNIYTAVYAAAHALHGLLFKPHMRENRNQQILQHVIPWQLNLKNVSFTIPGGKEIYFDETGNVLSYFDIWNGVILPNQTLTYVHVGTFDPSAPQGKKIKLNVSKIQWHPDFTQVPKSVCSESCSPGYRRAVRKELQVCCYECVPCLEGEISTLNDMDNCIKCKEHEWTDDRRDKCIQRETEYLSFHDYLGVFLTATCLFLCAISTGIYSIFYRHRATCIVRANNLHLSYILLFSLTLSFLSSLLFIGRPKQVTCLVRQVTFGIIFATGLSTLIGKTITVIIAFSATKPGSKLAKWMKTQTIYIIVLFLSIGQVVICLIWLICSPPFPDTDTKSKTGMIIVLCNEGSVVAFYIMIGYIGILAIVSFLLAYYARRLPDSFNESQLITFSMLVFCSVWVSFIPAYINTKGRSVVAVEVFAILTSNAGLLGFIFIPKCYIILFRPELNTKEHLMMKI
eukprot:XP_002937459.2 PREDICTED: vomeronasal type-2 receptor 26-like [Xenopus tropicalis]